MFVCCVCCKVEVSALGSSLVRRSPTVYGVSECDREASKAETTTRRRAEAGGRGLKKRTGECTLLATLILLSTNMKCYIIQQQNAQC
jgi:hypothetical protein